MKKLRKYLSLLTDAGYEFLDDNGPKLSASLAYYTIFSIGPLLLVIITLLGFFYKRAFITTEVFDKVRSVIGGSATAQLQSVLVNMSHQTNKTLIGIIGVLVFIFGATGIFSEIQSSVNYIWSVKAKPKRSWVKYVTDRLLSLVLVIGLSFLFMVTILLDLLLDMLSGRMRHLQYGGSISLVNWVNLGLLFVIVTVVFMVIFKVLPDARIHWKDALIGAAFTGILFLIGKYLISYYLSFSKSISLYGAATSIIVVLSWVYYSSMILYYGAAFTEVYAHRYGKGISVNENAVHILKHETKKLSPKRNIQSGNGTT